MGENGDKKGMAVKDYEKTESYMLSCMNDSAHDKEHVYRVLYYALEIAKQEPDVDYEILITSCLLHDIGRKEQFENPGLCHARVGGDKAYAFLVGAGWTQERALRVKQAVAAHRYRSDNPPESIEAKILFDADKLDVTGAVGIARTLLYKGKMGQPLYTLQSDGSVSDGMEDEEESFFREYRRKLENLYSRFFTKRGEELAKERREAAAAFYRDMLEEVRTAYQGKELLKDVLGNH